MDGTTGSRLILDFREPLDPPLGSVVPLSFSAYYFPLVGIGGFDASRIGQATVRQGRIVRPIGWVAGAFPSWPLKTPTVERVALKINAIGWQDSQIEPPSYVRWRKFIAPGGIALRDDVPMPYRVRLAGGYQPAPGINIILNFAENLVPPPGGAIVLEFGASAQTRVLGATLGDASAFGHQTVTRPDQIRASGFGPDTVFGTPNIEGNVRTVAISLGISTPSEQVPKPSVTKQAVALLPSGFVATQYGVANIWNWRQYTKPTSFDASLHGEAFVQGGVKHVAPGGIDHLVFGRATVINTTADQSVKPFGIEATPVPKPGVSPQAIFPYGIRAWDVGIALVQPNPHPYGFDASTISIPSIEYLTKVLLPTGIAPDELGYPTVFDSARKVYPPTIIETGVFGDTSVANKSLRLQVPGSDFLEFSPWAILESNRRYLIGQGLEGYTTGEANVANKSPSIAPEGFDALAGPSSDTDVGYPVRDVNPTGFSFTGIGTPAVTKTPQLDVAGLDAGGVGEPTIWPRARTIEAIGPNAAIFGEASAGFRYRYVSASGDATADYGAPSVEHGIRSIQGAGFNELSVGTPYASHGTRTVAPTGIYKDFPSAHMVGGLRYLLPYGYDAALFGSRIIPEAQEVYPLGFSGEFGWAGAQNQTQIVEGIGFITVGKEPTERIGAARAFNLVQYVTMLFDPDSELNPPQWPLWTLIENKNRTSHATGWVASYIGKPAVDNNARSLLPAGITPPSPPEWQKSGMVAYRIRPLHLDGLEPPYISGWGVVSNVADVVAADGFDAAPFGAATIENRSRDLKGLVGFDSAWCGYPFIAPRVRELEFEARYTIAPPYISLPDVQLHTRYIEPSGIGVKEVGAAAVEIHWTIIAPKWTPQNLYGYAIVRNVTPELPVRGYQMDEWGGAKVRLQWRSVAPDGALTEQFGKAVIADRKQAIFSSGSSYLRVSDKLVVTKTGAPPYSTQFIWLDSLDSVNRPNTGYGIPPPEDPSTKSQLGLPSLRQQVVYVSEITPQTRFGTAIVTANTIRVDPGIYEQTVGTPMVSVLTRYIRPTSIFGGLGIGMPRLSPHTIYAVVEATEQAARNHPGPTPYLIRSESIVGHPALELRHRTLAVSWWYAESAGAYGAASIFNRRSYITPTGVGTMRMGWHTVDGGQPRLLEHNKSVDSAAFGVLAVAHVIPVGPRRITLQGFVASAIANEVAVEFKNRVVYATGYEATRMGVPAPPDLPYAWQGMRIGPLMPTIPDGFDAQKFGATWISNRVRGLVAEGFNSFASEYDFTKFDQRMRVKNASNFAQPTAHIGTHGLPCTNFGWAEVRSGRHYIRPDGNSDQYRKGVLS